MNTRLQQLFGTRIQSPNQRRRYAFREGCCAGTASVPHVERLEDRTLLALVSVDGPLGADTETLDEDQGLLFLDITHSR